MVVSFNNLVLIDLNSLLSENTLVRIAGALNPNVNFACPGSFIGNYTLTCSDQNGFVLSTKKAYGMDLMKWADSTECNGRNGEVCLNIAAVQEAANPGIIVRCVKRSPEKLPHRFGDLPTVTNPYYVRPYHYESHQKNNTMSCETKEGKVLSTFSGPSEALTQWVNGPSCSEGPDKHCEYLDLIRSGKHREIEIFCIADHGRLGKKKKGGLKYTLQCKHNGVVLSTSRDNVQRLKRWARGPSCQPIVKFSTIQSTTTVPIVSSIACPKLQSIQAEIENESATLKCLEDNGKQYKLGCYIYNELVSTKSGTIEKLKQWARSKLCGRIKCACYEQFAALDKAKCVNLGRWQCQKTTVTGACSGFITQKFQHVKSKKLNRKQRPEIKKKWCEKMAQKTGCNPAGYVETIIKNCEL